MEGRKNRADPERFFPKAEASLEGAVMKMNFLREKTEIRVQVPLKTQIYKLIEENDEGLTVQEISSKLSLNTKTCAKVLDEMIYKQSNLRATAHRYGRVFVHKYHVIKPQEPKPEEKEPDDYLAKISPSIVQEIREIEKDLGDHIHKAISQSLKDEKKHSRQRITYQSYIRALFVMARVQRLKVCSVYDIKEMIRTELEPNAKWCLDKKTVLRIIWKLRNCGLIKELCFRIKLRKDDDHETSYLGDHYDSISRDKANNKSPNVMYKLLAAVPEILANDPLVLECPAIKNPTNRKPFTQNSTAVAKSSINIKSKLIREIVYMQNTAYKKLKNSPCAVGVMENLIKMEDFIKEEEPEITTCEQNGSYEDLSKAYSLAIFTKAIFKILNEALFIRYKLLFSTFRMPLCYTALKDFFNKPTREVNEKYQLAYKDFTIEKRDLQGPEQGANNVEMLTSVPLPKKRKHTLEDMSLQLQKIFLVLERKPGLVNNDLLKKYGKGIDTDAVAMMKYLSDLGFAQYKAQAWEIKYKYALRN